MKQFALFAFVIAAISSVVGQAQASSVVYEPCTQAESDVSCIDRGLHKSLPMKLYFYSGDPAQRPNDYEAIYHQEPELRLMGEEYVGATKVQTYLAIYRVERNEGEVRLSAPFIVTFETQMEGFGAQAKVVSRGVDVKNVKLVGERNTNYVP